MRGESVGKGPLQQINTIKVTKIRQLLLIQMRLS